MEDRPAFEEVVSKLKDKDSLKSRKEAVSALENFSDEKSIKLLKEVLDDHILDIRSQAAKALFRMQIDVISLLSEKMKSKDKIIRTRAKSVLTKLQKEERARRGRRYGEFKLNLKELRKQLQESKILGFPESIIPIEELVERLGSSKQVNDAVIRIIQSSDPKALDLLIEALQDANKIWFAVEALGCIGSPKAVKPLIRALENDELDNYIFNYDVRLDPSNYEMKRKIIDALVQIGDPRAIKPISKLLDHENSFVRIWASNALIELEIKN